MPKKLEDLKTAWLQWGYRSRKPIIIPVNTVADTVRDQDDTTDDDVVNNDVEMMETAV